MSSQCGACPLQELKTEMMRRADKEIGKRAEIDAVIRDTLVCRLALARGDEPYLVPVSFGYDGTRLFFHTALTGRKFDFFEENKRVGFEFERGVQLQRHPDNACQWTFLYESVIGYGRLHELTDTAEKQDGLNQIMLHYSGSEWSFDPSILAKTRLWSITIESITGKRSGKNLE